MGSSIRFPENPSLIFQYRVYCKFLNENYFFGQLAWGPTLRGSGQLLASAWQPQWKSLKINEDQWKSLKSKSRNRSRSRRRIVAKRVKFISFRNIFLIPNKEFSWNLILDPIIDFHWCSLIFNHFQWFSMIFIDFHSFSLIFDWFWDFEILRSEPPQEGSPGKIS